MRKFVLSITAWGEHQERPDRLNYSWFKFHAKTINGHFWSTTSSDELKVWICLLCLRNGQSGEFVHTNDLTLAGYCNFSPKQINEIIDKLILAGSLRDETRAETAETRTTGPNIVEESRVEESICAQKLDPFWLANTWNEHCGKLPKVKFPEKLDPKRKKEAREALALRPDAELWIAAIKKMAESDFCLGKKNSDKHKTWKAKFDFLVRVGTIDRVLEGEFDNHPSSANESQFAKELKAQRSSA